MTPAGMSSTSVPGRVSSNQGFMGPQSRTAISVAPVRSCHSTSGMK